MQIISSQTTGCSWHTHGSMLDTGCLSIDLNAYAKAMTASLTYWSWASNSNPSSESFSKPVHVRLQFWLYGVSGLDGYRHWKWCSQNSTIAAFNTQLVKCSMFPFHVPFPCSLSMFPFHVPIQSSRRHFNWEPKAPSVWIRMPFRLTGLAQGRHSTFQARLLLLKVSLIAIVGWCYTIPRSSLLPTQNPL